MTKEEQAQLTEAARAFAARFDKRKLRHLDPIVILMLGYERGAVYWRRKVNAADAQCPEVQVAQRMERRARLTSPDDGSDDLHRLPVPGDRDRGRDRAASSSDEGAPVGS